jgi:hypothetical protein
MIVSSVLLISLDSRKRGRLPDIPGGAALTATVTQR